MRAKKSAAKKAAKTVAQKSKKEKVTSAPGVDMQDFVTLLNGLSAYGDLDSMEGDAKFDAQELAYDAMEAGSKTKARSLAKAALAIYPDCVDALLLLVGMDAKTGKARLEGFRQAVAAGERSLGAKFIQENKGVFWGLVETRPYMRALLQLGMEWANQGRAVEAIGIYEEMLQLNPNDNQGVRDLLLGLYLATKDMEAAAKLLKKYKNDVSANFAWGRALERFLAGDMEEARLALKKAIAANRFVALHLAGKKLLPKGIPEMYSLGSVEEAMICRDVFEQAWEAQKDARLWLAARCTEMV